MGEGELAVAIARLEERLRGIERGLSEIKHSVDALAKRVDELEQQRDRALGLAAGIGAVAGSLVTILSLASRLIG